MTPSEPGRFRRALRHPLLLFPVKVVLVAAPMILIVGVARGALHWSHAMITFVAGPIAVIVMVTLFTLYTRAIERRAVAELSPHRAPRELIVGFVTGTLCMALVFGVLMASDVYHVTAMATASVLWVWLVNSLVAGIFEELLFRGVLFRLIEESWGSYTRRSRSPRCSLAPRICSIPTPPGSARSPSWSRREYSSGRPTC